MNGPMAVPVFVTVYVQLTAAPGSAVSLQLTAETTRSVPIVTGVVRVLLASSVSTIAPALSAVAARKKGPSAYGRVTAHVAVALLLAARPPVIVQVARSGSVESIVSSRENRTSYENVPIGGPAFAIVTVQEPIAPGAAGLGVHASAFTVRSGLATLMGSDAVLFDSLFSAITLPSSAMAPA
jgi:hypothetical protein